MLLDSLNFGGEVFDPAGRSLGEARFWGSAERSTDGAPWRGWLRVTDLTTPELARGCYRVRAFAGWEAEFEPLTPRPTRVYEIDLLPIIGVGDAPWPDTTENSGGAPYQPAWNDTPPRLAADGNRLDPYKPLELRPHEGRLRPDLSWPEIPDAESPGDGPGRAIITSRRADLTPGPSPTRRGVPNV